MSNSQAMGDTQGRRPQDDPHTQTSGTHPSQNPPKAESDRLPTLATNTAGEGVVDSDFIKDKEKARTAHSPSNQGADRREAAAEKEVKLGLGREEGTNEETTTGPAKTSDDPPIRS